MTCDTARQALQMPPIITTVERNGLARSLWAKQAATKAGGQPSGCHNLLTARHGRHFYLSRMVEQCGSFSLLRSARPVRFRAATSPATVYLPPPGRSLAMAPDLLSGVLMRRIKDGNYRGISRNS